MSTTRVHFWDKDGRMKRGWDAWFVYTAYAPMDDSEVLVKVGISTIPYTRFVTIHCNSPFPIEMAAFTSVGRKGDATSAERQILEAYKDQKTRGEWLRLPLTAESKKGFATMAKNIIESVTGKPVKWQRVTNAQLRSFMSSRMKDMAA